MRGQIAPNIVKERELVIISKEEVKQIIDSLDSIKHKTIISLMYCCGLKPNEIFHIKVIDIDMSKIIIKIQNPHTKNEREISISSNCYEILQTYFTK